MLLCHGPPESHDASLLVLDDFENDGVLEEDAEDVEDAHDHPRLHSRQTLRLGSLTSHRVENVHQHQEQGH